MNVTEQAIRTLKDFLGVMNKWEIYWYNLKNENPNVDYKSEQKKEIDAIYAKYLTHKERKLGRQVSLSTRFPSTFCPNDDIIGCELSADNKKISIEVQQKFKTGVERKFRYKLILKNNEWRVDRREMFDSYANKWIKDNL
jgi:hypothetical protein